MKIEPQNEGAISINSTGIGTVTPEMVEQRAVELALIDGRSARQVSESDREVARRELIGDPNLDPHATILESAPESEGWDPLLGSTGSEVPVTSGDEEDEEGRSLGEKLIDQGVKEADHDQMLQAARIAEKNDPPGS